MSILNWIEDKKRLKLLNAPKYVATSGDSSKGLWTRCDKCGIILYIKHLKENQRVCFGCSYHLQMMSGERIESLLDKTAPSAHRTCKAKLCTTQGRTHTKKSSVSLSKEGNTGGTAKSFAFASSKAGVSSWRPLDETVSPCDPLQFYDQKRYRDRLQDAQERTGLQDAIQTGTGMIDGIPVALAVMDFSFMGGSMGSVVGEKITRLIEYATAEGLTLLIVSASGGARMQEGVFSLMQMAKISSALYLYQSCANLLYISILTSPTTGGVTASFAMLGDIIFAEPKALIAFAGRRVIEQTLSEDLPDDFQTSEYMLHHGLVDLIVPRRFLRQAVSETIRLYQSAPFKKRGQIPFGVQNPISFLAEEKIRRNWDVLTKFSGNSISKGDPTLSDREDARTRSQSFAESKVVQPTPFYQRYCAYAHRKEASSILQRETLHRTVRGKWLRNQESNPFGVYRKLLTSFETMLDLFVSGNLVASPHKSPIYEGVQPAPHRTMKGMVIGTNLGGKYKSPIFNTSSFGNLKMGKNLIPFWLYKGFLTPKQDRGKNQIEKACLYRSLFSAKLQTHLRLTPSPSPYGVGQVALQPRFITLAPLLASARPLHRTVWGHLGCKLAIKALSPLRRIGAEQGINGKSVRNARTRSLVLRNGNGTHSIPYKADPEKKSFTLSSSPYGVGQVAHRTCKAKLCTTQPRKLINGIKQIALYKSWWPSHLPHTNLRFVTAKPFTFSSRTGCTPYLLCAYAQYRPVCKALHDAREASRNFAFRKIGRTVCTGIRESFFARSSRNEIDRLSLLHSFRVFSENGDLARNTVFGISTDLGACTLYLSRTYVTQKGVKEETKTKFKGDSSSNRSAIGSKHTDYFCDRTASLLQDKKKSYNFQWKSKHNRRGINDKTQIWTRHQENGFVNGASLSPYGVTPAPHRQVKGLVANSPTPPSVGGVVPLFSSVSRNTELEQNGKLTNRKDDINFLNQAIELAATEGVEWRAFYISQQLSESTGFLEDFLQQNPSSRKQNGNILFYKSICRSEKALGKTKIR